MPWTAKRFALCYAITFFIGSCSPTKTESAAKHIPELMPYSELGVVAAASCKSCTQEGAMHGV